MYQAVRFGGRASSKLVSSSSRASSTVLMTSSRRASHRLGMVSDHLSAAGPSSSRPQSTSAASASAQEDVVLFESENGLRKMILNRPKALNSLNDDMIDLIGPKLQKWEDSDMAQVVLFKGNGKSFCAGGDVRALIDNLAPGKDKSEWQKSPDFFKREYETDAFIANMSTPVVTIMHGNTMGGGVGLSVHAPFRIATESTVVAMPETKIGLFPDVGASFFLSRLDGQLGAYLGLTSETIRGVGAFYSGFATHFVPGDRLEALERRLAELDLAKSPHETVNAAIDEFAADANELDKYGSFDLTGVKRRAIDVIFSGKTADKIDADLAALEQGSLDLRKIVKTKEDEAQVDELKQWAKKVRGIIEFKSPTSVKLALSAIRRGASLNIDEAFAMDLRIATGCCNPEVHPDFREGVTHVLVKKDNKTRASWKPSSLADVTERSIEDNFFKSPPPFESPSIPTLSLSFRADPKKKSARPYKEYPHRRFGLPSEVDIRSVVRGDSPSSDGKALTLDELVERVEKAWNGKVGVRQKVTEVVERQCTKDKNGYLKWAA